MNGYGPYLQHVGRNTGQKNTYCMKNNLIILGIFIFSASIIQVINKSFDFSLFIPYLSGGTIMIIVAGPILDFHL